MSDEPSWYDLMAFPALLRAARNVYGAAIAASLAEAGCDDVPPNGPFVLGAIARTGAPLREIVRDLGVSKQAAGQLIDTLVNRGYLDRAVDPEDRRRLTISLTERGRTAAAASRSAIERLDADLAGCVGVEIVTHTRAALGTLVERNHQTHDHPAHHSDEDVR